MNENKNNELKIILIVFSYAQMIVASRPLLGKCVKNKLACLITPMTVFESFGIL